MNANLRVAEQMTVRDEALALAGERGWVVLRIIQRAAKPGPFIDGVYAHGSRRLWPRA
jgi:hypothetical protein